MMTTRILNKNDIMQVIEMAPTIQEGAYITGVRTGAAGAIGAKYLAEEKNLGTAVEL